MPPPQNLWVEIIKCIAYPLNPSLTTPINLTGQAGKGRIKLHFLSVAKISKTYALWVKSRKLKTKIFKDLLFFPALSGFIRG